METRPTPGIGDLVRGQCESTHHCPGPTIEGFVADMTSNGTLIVRTTNVLGESQNHSMRKYVLVARVSEVAR